MLRYLHLGQELEVLFIAQVDFLTLNIAPWIGSNLIAMHIAENVCLIPATVNIKLVEKADETMISTGLWSILRIQIDPLLLDGFEFS